MSRVGFRPLENGLNDGGFLDGLSSCLGDRRRLRSSRGDGLRSEDRLRSSLSLEEGDRLRSEDDRLRSSEDDRLRSLDDLRRSPEDVRRGDFDR